MARSDDEQPDPIELPPRLIEWIAKKVRAYHARKTSSKTIPQYKAGLEYVAAERLEIALQHQLSDDIAENIVFQALGKSSAVFHALITQALREREIRIAAERDVQKARADAQEPLIAHLQDGQEQMRNFMQGFGGMMERMMDRIEVLTQRLITDESSKEPKKDES